MMKSGFYTTGNDQLSGQTEEKLQSTSQSQTCNKKGSWSLFGGLLPVWSTTTSWILAQLLHLRSMLSKLMRCTENYKACSWHWSTEWAQFFSMTTPNCTSHNQYFNWTNWATKFCLIHHIHLTCHQLTTTTFKHLNNFLQGKFFYNQQEEESVFQVFVESQSIDFFYATGINIFSSKNVLIVMVPILTNKDVLEPSYNDVI